MRTENQLVTVCLLLTFCLVLTSCGGHDPVRRMPSERQTTSVELPQRVDSKEQRCLALNLYWEARGEGRAGMVAVGWTVLNRMRDPRFPSTACGVIHQGGERPPCQFSWWCDGKSDRPTEIDSWREVQGVASLLLSDPPRDPTKGSLFYHSTSIRPPWKRQQTARVGQHIFYR